MTKTNESQQPSDAEVEAQIVRIIRSFERRHTDRIHRCIERQLSSIDPDQRKRALRRLLQRGLV